MKNVLGIIILLGGALIGAAQNTKHYLDSVVHPEHKKVFSYNNRENNILEIVYYKVGKTWRKSIKSEYTYDDKGKKY